MNIAKHPLYGIYRGMLNRCENPNVSNYSRYGGRGIKVADEWKGRVVGFLRWLEHVGPRPSDNHQLDRIDNSRGYEPGNVRWSTPTENARNTRRNHLLSVDGVMKCVAEAAEAKGIDADVVFSRLAQGWSADRALDCPLRPNERQITYDGRTATIAGWSRMTGIDEDTLGARLGPLGWSVERALTTPKRKMKRAKNRRPARPAIEFNGITQTVTQWANAMKMSVPTLLSRLNHGWSVERALTTPAGLSGPKKSSPR